MIITPEIKENNSQHMLKEVIYRLPSITGEMVTKQSGDCTSILRTSTRESIAKILSELCLDEFLESLKRYDTDGDLRELNFKDYYFDYYALYALMEGKLTQFSFASLIYTKVAVLHTSSMEAIEVYNLSDEKAQKIIETNLLKGVGIGEELLSKNQFKEWVDNVLDTEESQHRFLLIPKEEVKEEDIFDALGYDTFNLFGIVGDYRIIPSFGMMQEYLNVRFDSNAMKIRPLIGIPSIGSMLEMEKSDQRAISLPTSMIPLPDTVDDFSATPLGWIFHDLYHLTTASCIPKTTRAAMLELATFLRRINEAKDIADLIADLEFHLFRNAVYNELPMPSFWEFLIKLPWDKRVPRNLEFPFKEISKYMKDNEEIWQNKYEITIDQLKGEINKKYMQEKLAQSSYSKFCAELC